MKNNILDLIIVGGGPMGIATAIEAKQHGLSHLILERGTLVNSLFHFPKNMTFFSTSERLEIGNVPFISHHEKPKRDEALEYYRRVVAHWELPINTYEQVTNIQKKEDFFSITTTRQKYVAKNVVVATGFYDQPNQLNISGEELPKVSHYFTEAHPYINKNVVVIGSANSATQVALELHYKGAKVTMIVREPKIGDNVKYWIKPNIENRISEGSITAYFNSNVQKITETKVIFTCNEKEITIDNDFVFAMTGYRPDYAFLEKIGIDCNTDPFDTPFHESETHQTNIKGLYVAGVVCGGKHTSKYFIENSKDHAERIIKSIV